jgi:hypothetical protein
MGECAQFSSYMSEASKGSEDRSTLEMPASLFDKLHSIAERQDCKNRTIKRDGALKGEAGAIIVPSNPPSNRCMPGKQAMNQMIPLQRLGEAQHLCLTSSIFLQSERVAKRCMIAQGRCEGLTAQLADIKGELLRHPHLNADTPRHSPGYIRNYDLLWMHVACISLSLMAFHVTASGRSIYE